MAKDNRCFEFIPIGDLWFVRQNGKIIDRFEKSNLWNFILEYVLLLK